MMQGDQEIDRVNISTDTAVGAGPKASAEGGFTLVEVLVGMFILGATMIPTSRVFTGGVGASAFAARQSEAVALASGALSKVQSSAYADVGFYGSQVSKAEASYSWYISGQGGNSYVYLGSNPPSGYDPLLVPVYSTQVGNTSFTVATYIDWANAEVPDTTGGVTTDYQAYKEASVSVRWYQADTQSGVVDQSTIVYPGAQGVYNGPGGASSSSSSSSSSAASQPGSPAAPATLSATKATGTSGSDTIDVTWSGGSVPSSSTSSTTSQGGYYVVEYSANINDLPSAYMSGTGAMPSTSGVAASPHQLPTATSYQIGGLAPGITYYMEVIAFGAGGQSWATSGIIQATTPAPVSQDTTSSSSDSAGNDGNCNQTSTTSCNDNGNENENSGCSVISLTVTGASSANTGKTYLTSNGLMSENLDLAASVVGCQNGTIQVSASPVGSSSSDPGSPYTLTLQASSNAQAGPSSAASQGAQFVGTVYSAGQSGWVTGQHLFNVVYDGNDVGVSASIIVYPWTLPSERSGSQNEC